MEVVHALHLLSVGGEPAGGRRDGRERRKRKRQKRNSMSSLSPSRCYYGRTRGRHCPPPLSATHARAGKGRYRGGLTCSRAWLHLKLLRLVSSPCHSCLYVPARRPLCCLTGWLLLLLLWIRSPGPQQPCRQRLLRRELWPLRQERGPGMPPTLVQRGTPTPARCISLPQPLCVLAVGILSRSEHGQNSHQARSQQSPPFGMRSTPDKSAQCQSSSCLRQYTAHRTRVHAYCKLPSSTQQSIPPARHLSRLIRSQVDLSVNASRFHRLDPLNAVRRVSNNTAAYRSRSNSRGTASSQSNWD